MTFASAFVSAQDAPFQKSGRHVRAYRGSHRRVRLSSPSRGRAETRRDEEALRRGDEHAAGVGGCSASGAQSRAPRRSGGAVRRRPGGRSPARRDLGAGPARKVLPFGDLRLLVAGDRRTDAEGERGARGRRPAHGRPRSDHVRVRAHRRARPRAGPLGTAPSRCRAAGCARGGTRCLRHGERAIPMSRSVPRDSRPTGGRARRGVARRRSRRDRRVWRSARDPAWVGQPRPHPPRALPGRGRPGPRLILGSRDSGTTPGPKDQASDSVGGTPCRGPR